jgi:hypothetical protein
VSNPLIDELKEAIGEGEPRSIFPPIVSAADFLVTPLPRDPEIITGVLTAGCKGVLSGASKGGKTWLLIDAAISVSLGEPWLSFKTARSKVLFLNMELKPETFQRRLKAVLTAKNIRASMANLDVWHLRGMPCAYISFFPKLEEKIRANGYGLCVLDPIYKCYGDLKENAAEDMGTLCNAIGGISQKTNVAFLTSTHHPKGNQSHKAAMDRVSGSGVIARDADALLDFSENETEGAYSVEGTLREFPRFAPFAIRWDYPIFRKDQSIDAKKLKQAKGGRPSKYAPEMLLQVLGSRSMKSAEWQRAAREETGISPAKFFELLSILRDRRLITKHGECYAATPETPETPETT